MQNVRSVVLFAICLACTTFVLDKLLYTEDMGPSTVLPLLWLIAPAIAQNATVDLNWYAPKKSWINDLEDVVNGTGTHGFVFNGSALPPGVPYGSYNWCNMPHVRAQEYPRASDEYKLEYVEVVSSPPKETRLGNFPST